MQVEITDKSLDLALIKASGQLGVSSKNLEYKVIREEKKLWGLLGKTIVIKAWVKQRNSYTDRSKDHQRRTRPIENKKEKIESTLEKATLKKLENFCQKLCSMIADEKVQIAVSKKSKYYIFNCKSEYMAQKVTKVPKLAESIERIILRVFKGEIREKSFRLFFDANGVRQNKEKELITLAKNLSKKAHKTQRTITLNYRHAYDRKIIHMTLDSDNRVYTKSVGSGAGRKLLIIPTKDEEKSAYN